MTPGQREYWRDCLLPKIDVGAELSDLRIDTLPFEQWSKLPIASTPWYWVGAHHTAPRGHNPVARIRSPGPPTFPSPKGHLVPAHRLIYHLLVTPLGPHDQVRFGNHAVTDRPNVNPTFHRHVERLGYLYEPPSIDELGGLSDIDSLVTLLEGGTPVSELLNDFSQAEIDQAQEIILTRT